MKTKETKTPVKGWYVRRVSELRIESSNRCYWNETEEDRKKKPWQQWLIGGIITGGLVQLVQILTKGHQIETLREIAEHLVQPDCALWHVI